MKNKYQSVYAALQDDISRIVFKQRLKYYYERNRDFIWEMYELLESHDKEFRKNINGEPCQSIFDLIRFKKNNSSNRRIVLYGCGGASKMPLLVLRHYGLDADFYCDRNSLLRGTLHHGILVISPQQLMENYNDAMVITASFDHAGDMLADLAQIGFNPVQVYYSQFFPEQMYFGFSEFKFDANEIYLDCGVSDGKTIKQFYDKTNGKYNRIYAFEPEPECYRRSLKFIEDLQIPNISLLNCGVYSNNGSIKFLSGIDGAAHISKDGDIEVPIKRIDDIIGDESVTFIKMDIEGAELEALKGAEKTIIRNKPKLAICLYHKPEDIPEILQYICSVVPDYKMWIRPYEVGFKESGDVHLGETLLYARM